MNAQINTSNATWCIKGTTTRVLQAAGLPTITDGVCSGTLYMRGANWYITGIVDGLTVEQSGHLNIGRVKAHGRFVKNGVITSPIAYIDATFTDSQVSLDLLSFTITDMGGRIVASSTDLYRDSGLDFYVRVLAELTAAEEEA